MTKRFLLCAIAIISVASVAIARDRSVAKQFQRLNPCPATGLREGACPGWEKDHVVPLCMGGEDEIWNFQWLTVEDHRRKTRVDVTNCAIRRRYK